MVCPAASVLQERLVDTRKYRTFPTPGLVLASHEEQCLNY